jgi:hypothetical protein
MVYERELLIGRLGTGRELAHPAPANDSEDVL